jgi:hypothetical protein
MCESMCAPTLDYFSCIDTLSVFRALRKLICLHVPMATFHPFISFLFIFLPLPSSSTLKT